MKKTIRKTVWWREIWWWRGGGEDSDTEMVKPLFLSENHGLKQTQK